MGLYIPGMEMPEKEGVGLFLYPDGRVNMWRPHALVGQKYEAVPVPPHGRLGDLDKLAVQFSDNQCYFAQGIRRRIGEAPTIIPAEEGSNG